jgi:hypothetical protein
MVDWHSYHGSNSSNVGLSLSLQEGSIVIGHNWTFPSNNFRIPLLSLSHFHCFSLRGSGGLFALTSGVVIVTYSSIKKQVSRIVGLSFIVLGCFELIVIINNFLMIGVLIPSHAAFLISAPITIICGAIISFKSKVFLRSKISS